MPSPPARSIIQTSILSPHIVSSNPGIHSLIRIPVLVTMKILLEYRLALAYTLHYMKSSCRRLNADFHSVEACIEEMKVFTQDSWNDRDTRYCISPSVGVCAAELIPRNSLHCTQMICWQYSERIFPAAGNIVMYLMKGIRPTHRGKHVFCGSQRNNDVGAWPWRFPVSICREATKGKKKTSMVPQATARTDAQLQKVSYSLWKFPILTT